jgi:hypothetical protein
MFIRFDESGACALAPATMPAVSVKVTIQFVLKCMAMLPLMNDWPVMGNQYPCHAVAVRLDACGASSTQRMADFDPCKKMQKAAPSARDASLCNDCASGRPH